VTFLFVSCETDLTQRIRNDFEKAFGFTLPEEISVGGGGD